MNKIQQYKELKQIISEKCKELKVRIKRLHYNIFAGVSKNSIDTQKDEIRILPLKARRRSHLSLLYTRLFLNNMFFRHY